MLCRRDAPGPCTKIAVGGRQALEVRGASASSRRVTQLRRATRPSSLHTITRSPFDRICLQSTLSPTPHSFPALHARHPAAAAARFHLRSCLPCLCISPHGGKQYEQPHYPDQTVCLKRLFCTTYATTPRLFKSWEQWLIHSPTDCRRVFKCRITC